ncbi:hypothetical protein INS49_015692 [Diaporthe citri]|uniref:uncharacterized protein n=1 Tax=Diaporthe citri TaxID=83186 RepID=UPI001C808C8C|nr:uncharacterized protein INS49_015692 [Diaporthe citri]KAG6356305.1 hypothetical protein INS49_015692 [Diaporthe citri]
MAFPDWLRIVLLVLSFASFLPQLQLLWLRRDSSGLSLCYVLFNLVVATELFTIDLAILVSVDGGDIFVHAPATTGDWLNLAQFGTVWVMWIMVLIACIVFYPRDQPYTVPASVSVIYTCYLLISLVPIIAVSASADPKEDRKWFDGLFTGFYILFLNPTITVLGVASLYPQCRAILRRPRDSGPGVQAILLYIARATPKQKSLVMKDDENPGLIYEAEDGPDPLHFSYTPLVLIHDGGGTCFSYYCLNPIGRIVYEIHNPHFYSAKPWPGGIPEMARHYVGLMRKAVPRGRILLGGWSLGGLLSLEMARVLADDPDFTVVGIAMVDSICPAARTTKTGPAKAAVVPYKHQFGPNTKEETIEGVERCFVEARKSIETWTMPRWDGSDIEGGDGAQKGTNGEGSGDGQARPDLPSSGIKCPRTILLRAREAVPTEPGEVSFVDTTRHSRSLGWDEYQKDFLEEIVDIPGHHFSIFAWEHIDEVSQKLMDACNTLEKMASVTAS